MAWFRKKSDTRMQDAEAYLEEHTALYRHYNLRCVQDILSGKVGNQGKVADLDDDEAAELIQRMRSKHGMR